MYQYVAKYFHSLPVAVDPAPFGVFGTSECNVRPPGEDQPTDHQPHCVHFGKRAYHAPG